MTRFSLLLCALLWLPSHSGAVILRGGTSGSSNNCTIGNANQKAACQTAANAAVCSPAQLGDYYMEIGNASGVLFSYQSGGSISRYSLEQLDSFTKFIDGAFWVQIRGGVGNLTQDDILHLHQQSGYVNMPSSCPTGDTVLQCAADAPGVNTILSLGPETSQGSGYPPGSVKTNLKGGTGTGATGLLTVNSSGNVTNTQLLAPGSGYLVGDSLTSIVGGGSGLAVPVTNTTCYPATGYTFAGTTVASNAYGALCNPDQYTFFYNGSNFQTHAIFDGATYDGIGAFYNLTRSGVSNAFNTELNTPTLTASTTSNSYTFTFASNYNWVTGMHVTLDGNVPAGFKSFTATNTVYYVTNVNQAPTTTTIQLSATKCNPNCHAPVLAQSSVTGVVVTVMPVTFSIPLIAGGANWSAAGMAVFMQNILQNNLLFNGALGTYEVTPNYLGNGEPTGGTDGTYCAYSTYPAQVLHGTAYGAPTAATTVTCGVGGTTLTAIGASGTPSPWILNGISQALGSPIKANYKYGIAHWVVSDPVVNGDGAFAGIGSKGVDGWIDPTKTYYGIMVRVGAAGTGYRSNVCDNLVRYAYLNASYQPGPYHP